MNKQAVTLIGSYRKNPDAIKAIFTELSKSYNLVSPKSIDFVNQGASFVKTAYETDQSINSIEEGVLEAIRQSDFVWLYAPSGYVGVSASFELGLAHSLGVPIFTDTKLKDAMLETMITERVSSPSSVMSSGKHRAGAGLLGLQRYYQRISDRRGWSNESPRDTMLLLTEEIGELARAIRKTQGLKRDDGYENVNLKDELADVQLYLIHLANTLGVALDEAVTQKEYKNQERHDRNKSA